MAVSMYGTSHYLKHIDLLLCRPLKIYFREILSPFTTSVIVKINWKCPLQLQIFCYSSNELKKCLDLMPKKQQVFFKHELFQWIIISHIYVLLVMRMYATTSKYTLSHPAEWILASPWATCALSTSVQGSSILRYLGCCVPSRRCLSSIYKEVSPFFPIMNGMDLTCTIFGLYFAIPGPASRGKPWGIHLPVKLLHLAI